MNAARPVERGRAHERFEKDMREGIEFSQAMRGAGVMSNMQLLVRIGHGDSTAPVLRLALGLAGRLGACLDGVQVVPLPPAAFTVPEAVPMQMDTVHKQYESAQARGDWFGRQLDAHGVKGEWLVAQGDAATMLNHMAAAYDLLVMMRDADSRDAPLGYGTVSRCVFGSCTPVLMLPAQASVTSCAERICVAWNGSRESTLALRGALPLLRAAAGVRILDGSDDPQRVDPMRPPVPDLRAWLGRHAVAAEIVPFKPDGPSGPAIESAAADFTADLVVMGAWGRSRISELVLGGATRHMLGHGRIPMLLAH